MNAMLRSGWLLLLVVVIGCAEQSAPRFTLRVVVTTDTGEPVVGASLEPVGHARGVSNGDGVYDAHLAGAEGERVRVNVTCPSGFRQNVRPLDVVLRRLHGLVDAQPGQIRVNAVCLPSERRGVLIVRAQAAPSLPVLLDGKPVGQTNEYGVAHVSVPLIPETSLRVTLDTSAFPRLQPASPSQRFVVEDRDGILAFDQSFTEGPIRRRSKRVPKRELPYRIN